MTLSSRYDESVAFLRNLDDDWANLVAQVGPCRNDPKAAREPYEALVRAVSYQQLTAKAGDAILARLMELFSNTAFPTPIDIATAGFETMRACGFSVAKITTIKATAEGAISGLVPSRQMAATMDDESLIARLMYSLERMDVLPVDDFGVREGYRSLKSLARQPKPKELREIGQTWAPHRCVMVPLAAPS
jgi:DNA-3-methyladenine glycosylase II